MVFAQLEMRQQERGIKRIMKIWRRGGGSEGLQLVTCFHGLHNSCICGECLLGSEALMIG